MDRYKLSSAGINVNEGIARFSGHTEIYEKYLHRFPGDEQFGLLCEAIERGDVKAAFEAAHALKGEAGNLSLARLYGNLCPLVEQLRAGDISQAASALIQIKEDYEAVIAVLSN